MSQEALDRIARSGEAVFAIDGADRIILWNKACETLVGRTARSVLGKRCYEVMCGRDVHGNIYCHRSCAVAHQAREKKDDPVQTFELNVKTGDGQARRLSSSLFAVPSYHPALTTLVHVLRPGTLPGGNGSAPAAPNEELAPQTNANGESVALTKREKEVLRCIADGMTTPATAKKLFIARVTVRNHIQNILQKLGVHTKLAAVVFAHQHHVI